MEEIVEVIGVEHLKTVLSSLTPEEIVKPAFDNWMAGIRTGHTVLNLENGEVYGIGIELNQLPLADDIYIELFTIKSQEEPVSEEDFFSKNEYEEFLKFSSDDPCEYIPDIITEFCELKGIDEIIKASEFVRDTMLPAMDKLRAAADMAETMTAESYYPFPTYDKLLFGV